MTKHPVYDNPEYVKLINQQEELNKKLKDLRTHLAIEALPQTFTLENIFTLHPELIFFADRGDEFEEGLKTVAKDYPGLDLTVKWVKGNEGVLTVQLNPIAKEYDEKLICKFWDKLPENKRQIHVPLTTPKVIGRIDGQFHFDGKYYTTLRKALNVAITKLKDEYRFVHEDEDTGDD